jgi:c-di-GMP-binding flagellar brake protein YcgR
MKAPKSLDQHLEAILNHAKKSGTSASLRAEGDVKMLGHLHVRSLETGASIQLEGLKLRDILPPAGTAVTLTLIQGDEVISIRTRLLEPSLSESEPKLPPVLQAAWPTEPLEIHPRREVRVATPDLPPLEATILWQGQRLEAKLLNLTDMGMGLGFQDTLTFAYHDRLEVVTNLPGNEVLTVSGDVRHSEALEGDELPTRVGLVLVDLPPETREALQRFIQARRMDRSTSMRGH